MNHSRRALANPHSRAVYGDGGNRTHATFPAKPKRHCVYIFSDADHAVLYVGLTCRFGERISDHKAERPWWLEVASVDVEHFPTREEARVRELVLIRELDPPHNTEGRCKVDRWGCDECDSGDVVVLTWGSEEAEIAGFANGRPETFEGEFVPSKGPSFLFCRDCQDYCDIAIRRADGTVETIDGIQGLPPASSARERGGV